MLRDQRDYLLRMIAQAAAAIARLREMLTGGTAAEEIVRQAQAAQTELLGKDAMLLRMLDPKSAAHALGDPKRQEQWKALLLIEAEALRRIGRVAEAEALESKAQRI
jgi:hypothetical protein